MDEGLLRAQLVAASHEFVTGCFVRSPEGDDSPPIIACARHKALAVHAELEVLAGNEEATLTQLAGVREAAIAAGYPPESVDSVFEARVSEVPTVAAAKRAALQTEAVIVDAALEGALAAIDEMREVVLLDDAELVARAAAILAREASARAAVAAVPVSPITSAFIGLPALPASSYAHRDVTADALFGRVLVAPVLAPNAHTPHCEPACPLRFAPHTHSAGCNHAPAPPGAVWGAASRMSTADAEAALAAGGSTEEADGVREADRVAACTCDYTRTRTPRARSMVAPRWPPPSLRETSRLRGS